MVVAALAQSQAFAGVAKAQARQSRRAVPVAAVQQRAEAAAPAAAPLRFLAAGLAAAALSVGGPAEAGVVLVQPEVKNFVKDQPAKSAASKTKAAAAPKAESSSAGGLSFEAFRPLVLPVSLIAVAGAGVAAVKADPEFAELMTSQWSAKDSNITGAGYETAPGINTKFYEKDNTDPVMKGSVKIAKKVEATPNSKKNFFGFK